MPDCKNLPGCPFFNDRMQNMPGVAASYKKRFCQGDSAECARFVVCEALGKAAVPADLFPNQIDRARSLVAAR